MVDQRHHNAHQKEDACELGVAPALTQEAVEDPHKACQNHQERGNLLLSHGELFQLLLVKGEQAFFPGHQALGRVRLDLFAVSEDPPDGHGAEHHKDRHPDAHAGINGNTGNGLGHHNGVRIHQRGRKAHADTQKDNGEAEHRVISQCNAHAHHDRNQAVEVVPHTEQGRADGKE